MLKFEGNEVADLFTRYNVHDYIESISAAFPTRTAALAYRADGIDGARLAAVPTGGAGVHWLWRIVNWVDV